MISGKNSTSQKLKKFLSYDLFTISLELKKIELNCPCSVKRAMNDT